VSFWLLIEWTQRGFFGERTQADGTIRMDITFRYALARQSG